MKLHDTLQEKLLLARLKNKDAEAFGEIYNIYSDRIYRFIFFKVATREEAEDITSDVFLKAWEYLNKGDREIQHLNAFFYQIARNTVIDYYRKKSQVEFVRDEDVWKKIPDHRQQRFLTEIEISADIQKIEKILKTLKDEYKDVVLLRFVEEMSIEEISQILDKSKGAVRVLLHRAIKLIKDTIK